MAKKNIVVDLDLNQNELQNVVLQTLSGAPASPKAGQIWYNTTDHYVYFYDGTESKKVGYLPIATSSVLGGVKIGTNISVAADGTISIIEATNALPGVIQLASDAEASAGVNETHAINPKQLKTAIDNAQIGALLYKGTFDITGASSYAALTVDSGVKPGYMYLVIGTGPVTILGTEWNAGDYLVVNETVAQGGTVTDVTKIDNTEAADIVRLNETQTLTNKTIDADDNTISDLTTSNFKSGTIVTTVGPASGTGAATDTELATSKAVRTELDTKQDNVPAGTQYDIVAYSGTAGTFDTLTRTTSIAALATASDTKIPTEKAVRTLVDSTKQAVNNPLLTANGGVFTWTISNSTGTADVTASVREVTGGNEVLCDITYTAANIIIKINQTDANVTTIAADTYRAVILS